MRNTIVIMAIIGLSSIALDRVHETDVAGDAMVLSGVVSESMIPAVEAVAPETGESGSTSHGVAHLKDIQAIADLGSLLLIGVALGGLVAGSRRESRKARAARRIT
jgi:hypothetical protein